MNKVNKPRSAEHILDTDAVMRESNWIYILNEHYISVYSFTPLNTTYSLQFSASGKRISSENKKHNKITWSLQSESAYYE